MPRIKAPGVGRTVESPGDLPQRRVLTITVDGYGHVDYNHDGMSPYEASQVAYFVSEKIDQELRSAWALGGGE